MKFAKLIPITFLTLFCIPSIYSNAEANGQFKITANIIDFGQSCYITGTVKDTAGNVVHPAEVTFVCGSVQTKTATLPGGLFVNNPPPCSNYTITATALGQEPASISGLAAADEETLSLDFTFGSANIEASLADAVISLKVISGIDTAPLPTDQTNDNRIGLDDAIFTLQVLAEIRAGSRTPQSITRSVKSFRTPLAVSYNVKLGKDTDGDGVDDWFQSVTTDANGYLEVDGLSNGAYSLTASSPDNASALRMENIKIAGRSVHLKTLRLKPVGSISGNVRLEGALDHSDIHVLIPGTSLDAFTDSEGNFTISNVPEGTYRIKASRPTYGAIGITEIPVEGIKNSGIDPFLLPSVVGDVSGTVWLQGLLDYTGILVSFRKDVGSTFLTTTNASGEYNFQDIPTGDYELIASMPGYVASKSSTTIAPGSNPQQPILLGIHSDKGNLTGTVTLDNLDDYSGILISLAGTQYQAITDDSGTYAISEIPEGTYTVFMKAEGYGAKRFENVQITSGQTETLNASLNSASGTPGTPYGSIVGTAFYFAQSDHSGISIKLEGSDIPLVGTDTNGGFIICNVPAGNYTLLFTQANYKTVTRLGVVVPPWNTVFMENIFMIPPVGNIEGTVHLEGETSHDNVTISVDGTSISAQSLSDGSFMLEDVSEGTYTITAYKVGFETARVINVSALPGHTVTIEEPVTLNKPCPPPTGISAAQGSGSSVHLQWTASSCDDLAGYNVYYGTQSDLINQKTNADPVTHQVFEVTELSKGLTYYFAVESADNDGLVSARVPSDGSLYWTISPSPLKTILTGDFILNMPFDISITSDGSKAYVSSQANATLLVIDFLAEDPFISGQIDIPGTSSKQPTALAFNQSNGELYVIDQLQVVLFVVDTTTDTIDSSVAVGAAPRNVIVSPDGSKIYVCSGTNDQVDIINATSKVVETTISLGEDADPYGMALADNKLYVTGTWSGKVYVIDLDSQSPDYHTVVKTIAVGEGAYDAVARQDGAYVYVSHDTADGKVSVIETSTDIKTASIIIRDEGESGNKNPKGMSVADNLLYVVNWGDSTVTMINTDTHTKLMLDEPLLSGGNGPENLVISPDGNKLYIVHSSLGSVEILSY